MWKILDVLFATREKKKKTKDHDTWIIAWRRCATTNSSKIVRFVVLVDDLPSFSLIFSCDRPYLIPSFRKFSIFLFHS